MKIRPEIPQIFNIRLELLRDPVSWTEKILGPSLASVHTAIVGLPKCTE